LNQNAYILCQWMEKCGLSTAREIVLLPIATIIEWQDGDGFVFGWEIKAIARPDVEEQSRCPKGQLIF